MRDVVVSGFLVFPPAVRPHPQLRTLPNHRFQTGNIPLGDLVFGNRFDSVVYRQEFSFIVSRSHLTDMHEVDWHFQPQGHLLHSRKERRILAEETIPMFDFVPRGSLVGDQSNDYGFSIDTLRFQCLLKDVVHLDFGQSLLSPGVDVMSIIAARLPWTLFTVGLGLLSSFIIGIVLGTLMAFKRDKWYEPLVSGFASFLSAIPDFLIAIFLLLIFGVFTFGTGHTIIPITSLRGNYSMFVTPGWNMAFIKDVLLHGLLPILTYMFSQLGIWILLMKGSTTSTLNTDYVTIAKVRGLKSSTILTNYIGRNAMLPIVTEFAMRLGFIIGGSLIIEQLFVYQGIGLELLNATNGRDYPLMQGIFLIMTSAIVLCNFLAEVLYVVLDPRIKLQGGRKANG